MRDLRVVISCVTFEVAKVVRPILCYKADRAYLLHWTKRAPYSDFIDEVQRSLTVAGVPITWKDLNILDFASVLKEVRGLIMTEKRAGNHVYVNIGAGPQVFSSAAMIACMMEGGTPFNAPTKEFTVESRHFYIDGRPVGIAKEVHDPKEIPVFRVEAPDADLMKGLAVYSSLSRKDRPPRTRDVMQGLCDAGLMADIFTEDKMKRISQGALMRYRRNFLEKWESHGWVEKGKRGAYSLTDQGKMMLMIFT